MVQAHKQAKTAVQKEAGCYRCIGEPANCARIKMQETLHPGYETVKQPKNGITVFRPLLFD
jgi:hypothetical protein